ncbi:His-rich protein BRANT [uncultured Bradyrhizobium sp.]|uniref:His-rich protein BRANT n=1 Tax=uncultured Bradyrhizobium sp. TaxID=199684 RepID=UPI0035C9C0ED
MIKTISAALLAVSVLAAPAMAGTAKTHAAPAIKSVQAKPSVLNANAKMGHHHRHGHHRRHYRHHR